MKSSTAKAFQWVALAIHSIAFVGLLSLQDFPAMTQGYARHWKFFTVWTHTLNLLFYIISVVNVLPHNLTSWLFKLSFTCSICVSSMFWGIVFVGGEDAFKLDPKIYPNWLNHAQHTLPCIIATLELILVEYAYHSLKLELLVILAFASSYLGFSFYLKSSNGWYPYPFMEQFEPTHWVVFCLLAASAAAFIHTCGRLLSRSIHTQKAKKQ